MLKRILSAAVAIPITLGVVLYGSKELFSLFIATLVVIGCREYFAMMSHAKLGGFPRVGTAMALLLLLVFYFQAAYFLEWGVFAVLTLFATWFAGKKDLPTASNDFAITLLGVGYVAGLSGYFILIKSLPGGEHYIILLFMIVWAGDSAAYFGGRALGKRPLSVVSPKKTLEGAAFGLLGSVAAAYAAHLWFLDRVPLSHSLLVGGFCGIISQFGDLAESLLKRSTGVKDSGTLIPGHGGVLDRIDSLLFAGPAFYIYEKFLL